MLKNSKEFFYKSECKVEEILLDGDNPQHRGIMNNFTNYLLGLEGINGVELMNAIELSGWLDGKKNRYSCILRKISSNFKRKVN